MEKILIEKLIKKAIEMLLLFATMRYGVYQIAVSMIVSQTKARLRPFVLWLHLMGEMASRSDDWKPIDRCTHAVFAA